MTRGFGYIFTVVVIIVFLIAAMMSCAFAKDKTFWGKVIDADTKEPIEGAVVVLFWYEARATVAGESTRLKDVKETLTNKNGEWSITGPEGRPHDPNPISSLVTGIHYTRHPQFIVFKPGYCSWPEGFYIEACKDKIRSSGEFMTGKTYELPRLKNREDRLSAVPDPDYGTDENRRIEFLRKQREFLRLINHERKNLGLTENRMYEEIQHEK